MAIIIVATPTSVTADGTSTITLDVRVLDDTTGAPMVGTVVTVSADGSDNTFGSMTGTTDASGFFQTTLESTVAQTETVMVAAGSSQTTASVTFVAGAPSATMSTLTASPAALTADGISTTTLTATPRAIA